MKLEKKRKKKKRKLNTNFDVGLTNPFLKGIKEKKKRLKFDIYIGAGG